MAFLKKEKILGLILDLDSVWEQLRMSLHDKNIWLRNKTRENFRHLKDMYI